MNADRRFSVHVTFAGLILFVRQNSKITYAILREGRRGRHGHGNQYPDDDHHCQGMARSDFDHHPLLVWETGCRELSRVRLRLQWLKDDKATPIEVDPGADPVPSNLDKLHLPVKNAPSNRGFDWVPDLADIGPNNRVDAKCLGSYDIPSSVGAQVVLEGGDIRTADFGYAADRSGTKWFPALKFATDPTNARVPDRAAAEAVVWDVDAPDGAKWLRVVCSSLDQENSSEMLCHEDLVFEVRSEEELWLTVSNSPKKRCRNQTHPGRRMNAAGEHLRMFYSLLDGDVSAQQRVVPWIPGKLRDSGPSRNAVKYFCGEYTSYECGWDAESLAERPLCIPAVAEG